MCSVVTFAQTNPASNTEILADTILKKSLVTSGRMQLLLMIEREQKKADASDGVIDKF